MTFSDLAALLVTLLLWGIIGALLITGQAVVTELWTFGGIAIAYIFGRGTPGNITLTKKE